MKNSLMSEPLFDVCESSEEHIVKEDNMRFDTYVSEAFQISRSKAANLIDTGFVSVNNTAQKKSYILSLGDKINIIFPEPDECDVVPENIPLDIVFEDSDLLVVNKEQGMVVHPAPGNMRGTLVNALMYHVKDLSGINGVMRPGIVHRIDKNTSGLLMVAKTDRAHVSLAAQIKDHSFDRFYEAVVHGCPKNESGEVRFSIGRSRSDRKKMAAFDENSSLPGVRKAVTHYEVLESFSGFSHLKLRLETGRTHQIRVHMKALGHPVVGDDVYASPKLETFSLKGQCLHAKCVGFVHPVTNEKMFFDSPLPDYFERVLTKLRDKC